MVTVAFHSYRGGTGKSTLAANFAAEVALRGQRVGLLEFDTLSPGLKVMFDVEMPPRKRYLNDLLCGEGTVEEAVLDLTSTLNNGFDRGLGRLFLLPASHRGEDIFKLLRDGYNAHQCVEVIKNFQEQFDLDFLFIDTHPGFEEDTLIALTASDMVVIVLRMDEQDYFGARIAVDISKTIGKRLYLLFNMVPYELSNSSEACLLINGIKKFLETPVIGVIPFYRDVLAATGRRLFVVDRRNHPFSLAINNIVSRFMEEFEDWTEF
mgnify:CR=1 FL=1